MASEYNQIFTLSWERLHNDTKTLARMLLEKAHFKGIIAVTRGGLIPAGILARELDIHLIDTLCISSYDWQKRSDDCDILKGVAGDGEGFLVIDDLVDTGNTAKVVRELLPKGHFATLYAKPAGEGYVQTHVKTVSQDTWVLFPWDSEVQYVKPIVCKKEH
ncbi:MAG: xanthine phosphoribosyltransferase [Mailhella sp.]|nr:xanthine phosphoribosyltransferase [Mailhella sp.]